MKAKSTQFLRLTVALFAALALTLGVGRTSFRADAAAAANPDAVVPPLKRSEAKPMPRNDREIKKIDPNTESVPFAGLAAKTPEEAAKALEGLSVDERLAAGNKLAGENMFADARVLYESALAPETAEESYLKALDGMANVLRMSRGGGRNGSAFNSYRSTLEKALEQKKDSWRVKIWVAKHLRSDLPTQGKMVDNQFVYDQGWSPDMLSNADRVRVRYLQLFAESLPLVREEGKQLLEYYGRNPGEKDVPGAIDSIRRDVSSFFISFAESLARSPGEYWSLQTLTDLTVLPDYAPVNEQYNRNRYAGAPTDKDGNPIFYATPDSFEAAQNDGERRQALFEEAMRYDHTDATKLTVVNYRALDASMLFGVQTLSSYRFFFNSDADADAESVAGGIWALNTLKDSETIAKLAGGVKRFDLPENYDYISLWREAFELNPKNPSPLVNIAREYENRRQLDKAAEVWRQLLETPGLGNKTQYQNALDQIIKPRVRFDVSSQAAGLDAKLAVRFRNATGGSIEVKRLNIDAALRQIRSTSFWQNYGGGNLVYLVNQLVQEELNPNPDQKNERRRLLGLLGLSEKIVGDKVADYRVSFDPAPNHYDRVSAVDFPVHEPGAFLVTVHADDGNDDAAIVWLRDLALVRKTYKEGNRFFVLDATTGQPLANREVELFAVFDRGRSNKTRTKTVKKTTDAQGSVLVASGDFPENDGFTLIATVPSKDKNKTHYAFLDAQYIYLSIYAEEQKYSQTRAFFISDRPIYRPGQKVDFQFTVGNAQYDAPEANEWAGRQVDYQINSPSGEKIALKRVTLDEYGSFSDSFEIPKDGKLGVYHVMLAENIHEDGSVHGLYLGDGMFRMEEYRKPEFKVSVDAPKEPVVLGDAFKATVNAKYYFGAPVTKATVSYKVTRTRYQSSYYPARYWDWFYGCGYWQFPYEAEWYPGWSKWGCCRIFMPYMYNRPTGVPEIVAEGEAEIGEDGTFEISVDSALAKLIYPNDDQQYEIEAEVVDQSRRVITGSGKVYAARRPFQTYVWFNRGYYKSGDVMTAGFEARRIDGKPAVGDAAVKLYKVSYAKTDDGSVKPIEKEVFSKALKTDEDGKGTVEIVAAEPGQYRLSCVVTTESGASEEGGQLIVVRGPANKSQVKPEFRFNALEIIPDKPEYSVGDVARVQIASNNPNAYVLFTDRPLGAISQGVPRFVKLENGTAYVDVKIETADQPNIFVQAWTVFDGKYYAEQKELAVPPEKRVLDVAVEPAQDRVKPGAKAAVKLRLTDVDGKPVVGQTVVAVYDKSLEAVSGGSNVGDIREFFWKWRRHAGLEGTANLLEPTFIDAFHFVYFDGKATRLETVGAFGDVIFSGAVEENAVFARDGMAGGMGGGMGGRAVAKGRAMAAPMMMRKEESAGMDMAIADEEVAEAEAPMAAAAAPMNDALAFAEMKTAAAPAEPLPAPDAGSESAPLVEAVVRKNLADVAYWAADLKPDDDGVIEIEIDMPENLTTWKIGAWSVGAGLRVGSGESEIVTSKDVIIRMQKPRFLTQKDEAVLTANVHNYLGSEKKVQVSLEFPTDDPEKSTAKLAFLDGVEQTQTVVTPANGESRVDWRVRADAPGVATLVMKALTDEESDAIQDTLTVKEHGIQKQLAVSGTVPAADKDEAKEDGEQSVRESTFTLTVPEERRPETAKLAIRFSPTLAGAIFDALPYLADYPYGCTEQTLNRFLPTVVAQKALMDAGVDLAKLQEKKANLNAQELGDAKERAEQWRRVNRLKVPVFDVDAVRKMSADGVAKLLSMQNGDGGWGWFYGMGEHSTPHLTALVARGLKLAQECDQEVDANALDRAQTWLLQYERSQTAKIIRGKVWTDEEKQNRWSEWKNGADSTDAAVYYALAELGVQPTAYSEDFVDYDKADIPDIAFDQVHSVMKELLWEARTNLQLYSLSAYAIALTNEPDRDSNAQKRIEAILNVLAQYRFEDKEDQTVRLDLARVSGWCFWSWFGGEYETQAYYLRLLNRVDRDTLRKLGLENDAPQLVKYLLNNRKNATYWNSTRDTALCVEAFSEYLQKTDELAPNETVEVLVDGEVKTTVEYTPDNLFETNGLLELSADEITSGDHEITLRVAGNGPLYYNAYLEFFTLEDPITKAGLELKTERRYYKLVERKDATATVEGGRGQAVSQRVERYDRIPLNSGDEVVSGDLIEVELIVDSKNEYESILLEDAKAAGYEPVEQLSGYNGNALHAYVEYRDDRVCFFASRLPEGRSTVTYRMRAETPGLFSALPTRIWAMYAPELKGNADEFKAKVNDR